MLLFSNAHVQHDLPFAYAKMGIETRSGRSRKPDHDAVNAVNARVFDGIEKFIAAHYDPSFSLIDIPFVPIEEVGTLELVKSGARAPGAAPSGCWPPTRPRSGPRSRRTIRETSTRWAEMISSGGMPGLPRDPRRVLPSR